jgi:dipeptide/tripeptide permease
MYYLVSSLAAISSPPLLGLMIDIFDYSILFYVAAISMAVALVCLFLMKGRKEVTNSVHSPFQ